MGHKGTATSHGQKKTIFLECGHQIVFKNQAVKPLKSEIIWCLRCKDERTQVAGKGQEKSLVISRKTVDTWPRTP